MELAFFTAAQVSQLFRTRELSPVEYSEALLRRIDRYDGSLNAFIRLTPDLALAQARKAEEEIRIGKWRGPLQGVPFALKDNIDVAGLPTTGHSKILANHRAATNACVTERLLEAGAVFFGKLALHEMALGAPDGFDLPWPPARNPWGRQFFSGSS